MIDIQQCKTSLPDVSFSEECFPLTIYAKLEQQNLAVWITKNKNIIDNLISQCGSLLFKGFNIDSAQRLSEVVHGYSPDVLDYVDRGAPRRAMAKKVFSSTEYACTEVIPQHHEMAFADKCPQKLFLCCDTPAQEGGFTPITDDRKVIGLIPNDIKQPFIDKGIMYVRNYGLGVDMSWQEAFDTQDKSFVEQVLTEAKTDFQWFDDDHLRTTAVRNALERHPMTGEMVWFNHAHLFHMSNIPEDVREFLVEEYGEDGLPRNVFYGDGSKIPTSVIRMINEIYENNSVRFTWEKGDMVMVDNFLATHGRTPFSGKRCVCVAMTDLFNRTPFGEL